MNKTLERIAYYAVLSLSAPLMLLWLIVFSALGY